MSEKSKGINNVTTSRLDAALRACNIQLDVNLIDRIINVIELIEDKGGETTLEDLFWVQNEWKESKSKKRLI